jgi:hypothetical protein
MLNLLTKEVIMKKALVLSLFLLAGVFSVSAQSLPSIRITNNTGFDVYYAYISPSDTDEWGEDFLGDDILLDGHSINIRLNHPLSIIDTYDFYLEDEDGDSYYKFEVKITNNTRLVFTEADLEF